MSGLTTARKKVLEKAAKMDCLMVDAMVAWMGALKAAKRAARRAHSMAVDLVEKLGKKSVVESVASF